MTERADLAIIGLGAMGSAAAVHAARRGLDTVGFDAFAPPHAFGSSHGESRIIREAYFEDPRYVPIVQRAYELWADLERGAGEPLWIRTGGLMIGRADSAVVAGARASADTHGLPYEMLDAGAIGARFPALRPADDMVAVWEPRAGVLFPEACVRAQLRAAEAAGATLHVDEPVRSWRPEGEGVVVESARRTVRAAKLVIAAGPWLATLLPELESELTVTRQPLFWFRPRANPRDLDPDRLPIHIWEWTEGRAFYGFPRLEGLVKLAVHHEGEAVSAETVRREVAPAETETLRELLRRHLPDADGEFVRGVVCLYTNTRDEHFLLDHHPSLPQVVVVSPCSGHGFKFAPAIGEAALDLAMGEAPRYDLALFGWRAAPV